MNERKFKWRGLVAPKSDEGGRPDEVNREPRQTREQKLMLLANISRLGLGLRVFKNQPEQIATITNILQSGFDMKYPFNETAARCKKMFIWLVVGNVLTGWLPAFICAWLSFHSDDSSKAGIAASNILFGCALISPFILLIPFAFFLHKLTRILKGQNYGLWIFVPISLIPFLGGISYFVLYIQASRALGEDTEEVPVVLPVRRCQCGGLMSVVSARQWRKVFSRQAAGYILNFKCGQCAMTIAVPSGLKMVKLFSGMVLTALFFCLVLNQPLTRNDSGQYLLAALFGVTSLIFGCFFFKAVRTRRDYPTVKPENISQQNK
jgi:hypothetical protein